MVPRWVWCLAILPWVWVIPFNQFFWDDWWITARPGIGGQIDTWSGGAKHFLNPWVFAALLPFGAWMFHIVIVGATVLAGVSLTRVLEHIEFLGSQSRSWIGPIFIALPVFHARFSVATIEYSVGLAATLAAWALLLKTGLARQVFALLLLVFAIGVPSLALIYPLIFAHVVSQRKCQTNQTWIRAARLHSPIIAIPVAYALIFRLLVDSREKYQVSTGALIEFTRGLLAIIFFLILPGWILIRRNLSLRRSGKWIGSTILLSYAGFLPYFAVGYNPLSDFLPWRMREEVTAGLVWRVMLIVAILSLVAVSASAKWITKAKGVSRFQLVAVIGCSTFFAAAMFALGPMDWESRHWLIAWPALSAFVVSTVATVHDSLRQAASRTVFLVFLAASLIISCEYMVDSIKQKSLVKAVESELGEVVANVRNDADYMLIVVEPTESTRQLNARFRTYRPQEWWGLIRKGLSLTSSELKIMEPKDVVTSSNSKCPQTFLATRIRPEVVSGMWMAISEFSVEISLNVEAIQLCSTTVREGYPKDVLP